MLIVSSLQGAAGAYSIYRPRHVISVLGGDETVPDFPGIDPARHLKLYVAHESSASTIDEAARMRAERIIAFSRRWNGDGDVLILCNRGVARSTAAAFIMLCMQAPTIDETLIAARLRKAAPYADPCPLLVAYADAMLERDGRMIDAIEDMSLPSPALSAPVLTLPLAA